MSGEVNRSVPYRRWATIVGGLVACVIAVTVVAAQNGSDAMRITFTRSGGVFAGLTANGTIDLGATPRVTSGSSAYVRALAPDEAERLRAAVATLRKPDARAALVDTGKNLRDAYHYAIDVDWSDGTRDAIAFNASGSGSVASALPALAPLVEWIDAEAAKLR